MRIQKATVQALSKTCWDDAGEYNRQRRLDSRDAVLSETVVQGAFTT